VTITSEKTSRTDFRAQLEASGALERGPSWLAERRRKAMQHHEALGLPTRHLEDWRYTNVAPIARTEFATPPADAALDAARCSELFGPGFDAPAAARLVFLDGRLQPTLSRTAAADGLRAGGLADGLAGDGDALKALGELLPVDEHAFAALNTALFSDGACVRVDANRNIELPIRLFFATSEGEAALSSHPRLFFHLGRAARARVVESWAGRGTHLTNVATEIALGDGALLERSQLVANGERAMQLEAARARLGRDASLRSCVVLLGGPLNRSEIGIEFSGEGASCSLNGLYVVRGDEHADCQTFVDHAVGRCGSEQVYHGVLSDEARAVFSGRVLVREDAQATSAHQQNRNLILGGRATADTKPQLEIFADDVQCSHGATVGRLDDASIFYMRSRGIDEPTARAILTRAFANRVGQLVPDEALRAQVEEILERRFEA